MTERRFKFWITVAAPMVCLMGVGYNNTSEVLSWFTVTIMPTLVILAVAVIHPVDDQPNLHVPFVLTVFSLVNVLQMCYRMYETLNYPMGERIFRNLVCITSTVIFMALSYRTIQDGGVRVWQHSRIALGVQLIFRQIFTIILYVFCTPGITFPPGHVSFIDGTVMNFYGVLMSLFFTEGARIWISTLVSGRWFTLTLNDIAAADFSTDVGIVSSATASNAGGVEIEQLPSYRESKQVSGSVSSYSYGTESEIVAAFFGIERTCKKCATWESSAPELGMLDSSAMEAGINSPDSRASLVYSYGKGMPSLPSDGVESVSCSSNSNSDDQLTDDSSYVFSPSLEMLMLDSEGSEGVIYQHFQHMYQRSSKL